MDYLGLYNWEGDMKNSVKKLIISVGLVVVLIGLFVLKNLNAVSDFHDKYEGVDLLSDVEGMQRTGTYTQYLNEHSEAGFPQQSVDVDLFAYTSGSGVEQYINYEGADKALYTSGDSSVTWELNIPETGFYNIDLEYMAVESRGVAIERSIAINGENPFSRAANITFSRIWKDAGESKIDNQGNEIRPTQIEEFDWQSEYCKDDMGYITEPYQFYFEKGKNTLTLEAVNEPMVIKNLSVTEVKQDKSYDEYIAEKTDAPDTSAYVTVLQGEDSVRRSEPSLYAKYDRASPNTQPYSITNTILNYTGGDAWRASGQWIEWDFEVPQDGFYNIMIKGRQNYARGSISSRSLYIDGELPFKEMEDIRFGYDDDWDCKVLGSQDGKAYKYYLTAGTHTLRMEATLGGMGNVLEELEDSTFRLNQIYRKLLVYTGASPDKYRDYNIHQKYPEIIDAMSLEAKRLYKIVDEVVAYTGQKADKIATAQTLAQQLERFVDKPEKITLEFINFKDNITALGTAIQNMTEIKLDVDYITISGDGAKVAKDKANVFSKAWHEVKSFVASFIVDYNSVGDVYSEKDEVVKVWVLTGRDQGTILKTMVDDTFTPESGVKVNVEIVAPEALLSAIVAGRGPNVVLSLGADQPVNYALRNAAEDLSQFPDYKEVLAKFPESTYRQYSLDDSVYGLPETMMYNVMFYRKDVLEELGLEPPETWQELIEMLPTIQGNNLSVGIPTAAGSSTTSTATTAIAGASDLSMYFTLLYQYGGDLYNPNGTETIVNSEAGVQAFKEYVKYFNDYGLPTIYDFVSRFRSGEMPIGVANFSTYNTLMVSAPEIKGLWDFTLVPGTERVDESGKAFVDRSAFISGSATMMARTPEQSLREKSWEFMKWWVSTDTQVRFGREMEALLGSSARYATANPEAFSQLAWSARDIDILTEQLNNTIGIREVPGGYYTGRHITNAIRKVINEKEDSRETILDYSITIDEEITKKRKEFGLPVE